MTSGRRTSEGEEREAKWLAGTPNGSGGSLLLSGSKGQKREFLSKARGRRTIAILLRAKDKRLTETRGTPKSFKPVLKTEQSLLARERRKILQWNPVENKISNFGDIFPLHSNFVYHSLSLSIWRRIKAKKRHLYSWTIQLYVLTLWTYIYNRSKEPMYFHFTMWSMLLFHAFLSASIRLMLSCLELSN